MIRQATTSLEIATTRQGLVEITGAVCEWLAGRRIDTGLLTIFCRHTSASLLIQENAAADVRSELERSLRGSHLKVRTCTPTMTRAPTTCPRICAPR